MLCVPVIFVALAVSQTPGQVFRNPDGVTLDIPGGALRLQVFTPDIVRVRYTIPGSPDADRSLSVVAQPANAVWDVAETTSIVTLRTSSLRVKVDRSTGTVTFLDAQGRTILAERPGRSLTPTTVAGSKTLASRQAFALVPGEAIYGLGQHQQGLMDYRGSRVHLQQQNMEIAIPVMVSSRGYGLLWDNPAVTDVDVAAGLDEVIPSSALSDEDGRPGGLTARYYEGHGFDKLVRTGRDPVIDFDWSATPPPGLPHDHYSVRWSGHLTVPKSAEYTLVPSGDDGIRLKINGKTVAEDWSDRPELALPTKVRLVAGKNALQFEYYQNTHNATARLSMRTSPREASVTWSSEAADAIDYYFLNGPDLERVIANYRKLTGPAPMFARWVWGLWQSRERYKTQDEVLDVAARYRAARIPLDGIVQDWQYWPVGSWGTHSFDPARYSDPKETVRRLHEQNVKVMISVWPKFDVGSANSQELIDAGAMYPKMIPYVYPQGAGQWYDPFNEAGRRIYWDQVSRQLAAKGFDAWWLDASEAELGGNWGEFRSFATAMGPGYRVYNAYPLVHTQGVYVGHRRSSIQRAMILTRSAYAGQQRNAAISWSGDIQATWAVLARQVPAGLNFSLSGIPYWNTDTGGFFGVPPVTDTGFADLFSRWFEFSVFCPMLRIHGTDNPKEIWRWPEPTRTRLVALDELRYHLLPYIYSTSWQVTSSGSSMLRPLVMDFPSDPKGFGIADQYLFGKSIMACPVTKPGSQSRSVYLPSGTTWVDFWTGRSFKGGSTLDADAVDKIPLFVRAGSILPYGPRVQSSADPQDPTELRVYPGANGAFTLYDDEGDGYAYETGAYATIQLKWDDRARTLSIGGRQGSYPGLPARRTFRVVLVRPGHGIGIPSTPSVDRSTAYDGRAVSIRLEGR